MLYLAPKMVWLRGSSHIPEYHVAKSVSSSSWITWEMWEKGQPGNLSLRKMRWVENDVRHHRTSMRMRAVNDSTFFTFYPLIWKPLVA